MYLWMDKVEKYNVCNFFSLDLWSVLFLPLFLCRVCMLKFKMASHNKLGVKGEMISREFLRQKGYEILHCNWRYRNYEVDIIARDNDVLVFVEVKTRSSLRWGLPEVSITETRIKRLVEAAHYYLLDGDIDIEVRFDVISILWSEGSYRLEHFEDAFLPPLE